MVEVADLKAKLKVDGQGALSVLEKLDQRLEAIGDGILDIDQNFQEMAKRGAESMGFLSHSMAYAFGGIIKDSVQWLVNNLKDAWDNAKELSLNLEKLKFGTGIDILPLQRMKAILEQNNVSFEEFLGAISKVQEMQARMKYGQMSQDELFAFGRLGINPREYGNAQSLLEAIGNSLSRIGDIGERNMLASKLKISPEVLRGLGASGWYDEFAALTDEEQQKMLEYAKNSKALAQEISATWTKLVSKFVTEDGIKIEEWALRTLGDFNKIVSESNTLEEAFGKVGDKISSVFDIGIEDTKFVKGIKWLSSFLSGAFSEIVDEFLYKPAQAVGAFMAYLTDKNVTWQDVVDTVNGDTLSPTSPQFMGSTGNTVNQTNNIVINANKVDGESIQESLPNANVSTASYCLMPSGG